MVATERSVPQPTVRLWGYKTLVCVGGGGWWAPVSPCGSPLRGYSLPLRCINQWQEARAGHWQASRLVGLMDEKCTPPTPSGSGSTHAAINYMFTTRRGAPHRQTVQCEASSALSYLIVPGNLRLNGSKTSGFMASISVNMAYLASKQISIFIYRGLY